MTDYLPLRIALAEGKCVTDWQGQTRKWMDINEGKHEHGVAHMVFAVWENGINGLFDFGELDENDGIIFGPNSKVVPDPSKCHHAIEHRRKCSLPEEGWFCFECGEKLDDPTVKKVEQEKSRYCQKHGLPYLGDCRYCVEATKPKSLTYDEAIKAFMDDSIVSIEAPDGEKDYFQWSGGDEGIDTYIITSYEARLHFDLAERRGYRMENVSND